MGSGLQSNLSRDSPDRIAVSLRMLGQDFGQARYRSTLILLNPSSPNKGSTLTWRPSSEHLYRFSCSAVNSFVSETQVESSLNRERAFWFIVVGDIGWIKEMSCDFCCQDILRASRNYMGSSPRRQTGSVADERQHLWWGRYTKTLLGCPRYRRVMINKHMCHVI